MRNKYRITKERAIKEFLFILVILAFVLLINLSEIYYVYHDPFYLSNEYLVRSVLSSSILSVIFALLMYVLRYFYNEAVNEGDRNAELSYKLIQQQYQIDDYKRRISELENQLIKELEK